MLTKKIDLFGEEVEIKNYTCSRDKEGCKCENNLLNLYIQITDSCNANCIFCDKAGNKNDNNFDSEKFKKIYSSLDEKSLIAKISITGGEPFLKIDKLNKLIEIILDVNPNAYISINTNGTCLYNFYKIKEKDKIKEVVISRHHYDELLNEKLFGIKTFSLNEIETFIKSNPKLQVKFNCVLSKGFIENSTDVEEYLNLVSNIGLKEVRFITMLDLVEGNSLKYIDPTSIIKEMSKHINDGMLYDRHYCECFNCIFISDKGYPIEVFIRNTKQSKYDYTRQLVYNSSNNLLKGFNDNIII